MATKSCEPQSVLADLMETEEEYKRYINTTKCLDCYRNKNCKYPIMGGYIIASFCELTGEWLMPQEYNHTIAEMGCD